jgi:hypothetical protein
MLLPCPYLSADVELTEERQQHIQDNHPDLLPEHIGKIADTRLDPDQILCSSRFSQAQSFVRWFESVRGGKYIVAVVVGDGGRDDRHWIVTAYIARKLSGGVLEWQRS